MFCTNTPAMGSNPSNLIPQMTSHTVVSSALKENKRRKYETRFCSPPLSLAVPLSLFLDFAHFRSFSHPLPKPLPCTTFSSFLFFPTAFLPRDAARRRLPAAALPVPGAAGGRCRSAGPGGCGPGRRPPTSCAVQTRCGWDIKAAFE